MPDVERPCLRNQPDGPLKCELPAGSHENHQAYSVALGRVVTWPNASVKAKPPKSSTTRSGLRKTSIRQVSDKEQADVDVLTGIMAERVWAEIERHPHSPVFFCQCGLVEGTDGCFRQESDPQTVLDNWHPHHAEKRRKGPKANRHNVFASRSRPSNIFIVSPTCHQRIEKNDPEWSRAS